MIRHLAAWVLRAAADRVDPPSAPEDNPVIVTMPTVWVSSSSSLPVNGSGWHQTG